MEYLLIWLKAAIKDKSILITDIKDKVMLEALYETLAELSGYYCRSFSHKNCTHAKLK